MTDTPETQQAIAATLKRIVGTFGGGYALDPNYLAEIGDALLAECPTLAVFRATTNDLLGMDPTGLDGRRRVPTPADVRRIAREHTPADEREECPACDGTGWLHRKAEAKDPCGTGLARYDVAERCYCGKVYRPPTEPRDATMTDIRQMVADGGEG